MSRDGVCTPFMRCPINLGCFGCDWTDSFLIFLVKQLFEKLRAARLSKGSKRDVDPLPRGAIHDADAIVTCNEVTDRHGTGVLLGRIFGDSPNILSIRSTQLYPEHSLGKAQLLFGHEGLTRRQSFERIIYALNRNTVRRIVCVPYLADELVTAIVLKELFNVPLCTYLMDDNNIHSRGIPDELMREVLQKSKLRLAISPELRDAYEAKYDLKFWVVPPVVNDRLVQRNPLAPAPEALTNGTGVLIGTLWSRAWLEKLRETTRGSGVKLHWYGNARAKWLKATAEELKADGIIDCGFLPETELLERLKQYAYAVVPSGTLDQDDDRPEIAHLSLPTRMPFLLAAANMPTIVLGSPETAAARFIQRFAFGRVLPYEASRFGQEVKDICRAETQLDLRARAATQGGLFSAKGLENWIWKSLELGEACDDRFERAFARDDHQLAQYIDPPVPADLQGDFALVFQAFRRLKNRGFQPDFIVDVGASSGVWSDVAKRVFAGPRFLLVDPLVEEYRRHNDWFFRKNPDFELVAAALSDRAGSAELSVSPDMYGSSLVHPFDERVYASKRVPVRTLDDLAKEKGITGRGLLKVDVQFTEHLVLAGAKTFLSQVDVLLLELSLVRSAAEALLFPDMCELVRNLGFHYYEDVGGWRSPVDGTTLQKDVIFVREHLMPEREVPAEAKGPADESAPPRHALLERAQPSRA